MTSPAERIQKRAVHKITHEFLPNRELEQFPWSEAFKQLEELVLRHYSDRVKSMDRVDDAGHLLNNVATGRTPLLLCFVFNRDHTAVRILPYPEQYEPEVFGARIALASNEELVHNWPGNVADAVARLAKERPDNTVVVEANLGRDRGHTELTAGYLYFNGAHVRPLNKGLASWIRKTRDDLNSINPTPTVNTLTE